MLVQIIFFGQQKSDCYRTTDNAISAALLSQYGCVTVDSRLHYFKWDTVSGAYFRPCLDLKFYEK